MPVNKSDRKFFEVLQELMQQSAPNPNEPISIQQVRQGPKQCQIFVDTPEISLLKIMN